MVEVADIKKNDHVYDIGAGDGRLLAAAWQKQPTIAAIGFEFVPTVWMWGKIRLWWQKVGVKLLWRNAHYQDLSEADVLFTYLLPPVMKEFEQKFVAELKPGSRVVSNAFALPSYNPTATKHVQKGKRKVPIYLYVWPPEKRTSPNI